MSMEITLPELGEGIEGGDVLNILVSVGDTVAEEDGLLEVETDKATVEVPSPSAGTVEEILVSAGDTVAVGQVIVRMSGGDAAPAAAEPEAKEEAPAEAEPAVEEPAPAPAEPEAPSAIEVPLPELGEGIEGGSILSVLVSAGDIVSEDDGLLEVETDKATVEVPSPVSGTVTDVKVSAGDDVNVGQLIFVIEGVKAAAAAAAPSKPAASSAPAAPATPAPAAAKAPVKSETVVIPVGDRKLVPAAPHVRKFAFEIGIDITEVPGTGPKGRISIADVKAFAKALNTGRIPGRGAAAGPVTPDLPDFSRWGGVRREKMSKIRQVTAKHMSTCWTTIPHVTQFDKVDITELEAKRHEFKNAVAEKGGKLTVTAMLLKAVAMSLREFPNINSAADTENKEVIFKDYVHIGIAVDTPNGLMVPVIRDADQKSILDLSIELGEMAGKARDRKIKPEDLQGGCFTITNLGGIGGTYFTPIVNWPEAAILGVSRSSTDPIYIDGEFQPRLMMPLSLSYDHRIVDGADGIRFLNHVSEQLIEPTDLLKDLGL